MGRVRYLIDTVFGQLTDRCQMKRVWARDAWHLWSRLLRKVLSHTLALLLNQTSPERLQLAKLILDDLARSDSAVDISDE